MPTFSSPDGSVFEIPDEWWSAVGMDEFVRHSDGHLGDAATEFMAAISDIQPLRRDDGVALDFQGLRRDKMVPVLKAFVANVALPPIPVVEGRSATHRFVATDGFHRHHASIAVGFITMPARKGWLPEV